MHKYTLIPAALFASLAVTPAFAEIPQLGVEKTCHAAQPLFGKDDTNKATAAGNLGNNSDRRPYQNCMLAENAARKSSADLWSKVNVGDRDICVGLSRMVYPSYVELMSCLQMYDRTIVGNISKN